MNITRTMEKMVFRPRAQMMTLLGDESISDETVGLLELVKNAYDADATEVYIELSGLHNIEAMRLVLRDNGCGMTWEDIQQKWLSPATNHKKKQKREKKRTLRGRLPIGEKGVGRFAAQKLGRRLMMVSRASGAREVVVKVNWDDFEKEDAYLDDVELSVEEREAEVFSGSATGTLLVIEQGRTRWTKELLKKLQRELRRLQSPFQEKKLIDFRVRFRCPDYPEYEKIETSDILDRAHYVFRGYVNSDGTLEFDYACCHPALPEPRRVVDNEVRDLTKIAGEELPSGENVCGPFHVNFYVWERVPDYLQKSKVTRAELDVMAGVSIFRDGLRVLPYGESGNDWLDLDKDRINDPTNRISNQNIIGFVEIRQEDTPDLRDKTNREGLMDTDAFKSLRALVRAAMTVFTNEWKKDRPEPPGKQMRASEQKATQTASEAVKKAQEKAEQMAGTNGHSGTPAHGSDTAETCEPNPALSPAPGSSAQQAGTGAQPESRVSQDRQGQLVVSQSAVSGPAPALTPEASKNAAQMRPDNGAGASQAPVSRSEDQQPVGQAPESEAGQEDQASSGLSQQREDLLELMKLLEEAADHQQLAEDVQEQERQRLFQLAATGMAAERVVHEFGRQVVAAGDLLLDLRNASRGNSQMQQAVEALGACIHGLRNEFRALAPYEAGYRIQRTRLVEIMEPVQTAALLNQRVRQAVGISLEVSGTSFEVAGRPASLVQVFDNIFTNACTWLERQQSMRFIRVRLDAQARTVSIEDTGPGIPVDMSEHIFLPGTTMRNGGRGLGLYIVRELLAEMRTSIELDQGYRGGARFIVTFPGSIAQSKQKGRLV